MFGLPAAAIAIWRTAKPKNRALTGGIMISAAFTSFLTGITEPIEFSFMFVAPPLYAIHAVMAGFCDWLFVALGGRMGFTFSQGFIDFFLFNGLGTKAWLIPALGPFFAALYFCVFYFGIRQFNFSTPGREDEVETVTTITPGTGVGSMAMELVRAFGGRSNIATLDACITRLRITVNDIKKVNKPRLKALGASGVLEMGNSAQAIFGPRSENLKTDMMEYLKNAGPEADFVEEIAPEATEVNATEAEISSPIISDSEAKNRIQEIIIALGGKKNIQSVDAVALTRLRVKVIDNNLVDEDKLKTAGVEGILRLPDGILHLLVGLGAEQYAAQIQD
jgi:PTS system glucose-specific IIC component